MSDCAISLSTEWMIQFDEVETCTHCFADNAKTRMSAHLVHWAHIPLHQPRVEWNARVAANRWPMQRIKYLKCDSMLRIRFSIALLWQYSHTNDHVSNNLNTLRPQCLNRWCHIEFLFIRFRWANIFMIKTWSNQSHSLVQAGWICHQCHGQKEKLLSA